MNDLKNTPSKENKYGWISIISMKHGNPTYIYKKLDDDKKVLHVSFVTESSENHNSQFKDAKCLGQLGDFIKKIDGRKNLI